MEKNQQYDVIIIGGSYAGLSAAMSLGRAIRKVLVIDDGNPCNKQTPHSHNFLGHDGNTPATIGALAKKQVLEYPTITFINDRVISASGINNDFEVGTAKRGVFNTKKLLFTTGIKDLMPGIPGFADCWGISVIHCPYCHGYEYKNQVTGILMNGEAVFEMARLIHHWTHSLTVFTNGGSSINEAHRQQLAARSIPVIEKEIREVMHRHGQIEHILFEDGSTHTLDALYARLPFEQHCLLPAALGCAITEAGYVQVDDFQKTTVPGIYAAGDNTSMMRALSVAVAAGCKAGAFINHEFIAEEN